MTPMRKRMIRELDLRRKSPRTIEAYVTAVAQLAGHYGRSPDRITLEELRGYWRAGIQRGHGIHTLRHSFATHLIPFKG